LGQDLTNEMLRYSSQRGRHAASGPSHAPTAGKPSVRAAKTIALMWSSINRQSIDTVIFHSACVSAMPLAGGVLGAEALIPFSALQRE